MRPFALFLVLFAATIVPAAAADGTVTGVVSDPSGAVVPGAVVELLTPAGALLRDTHTDGAGVYRFDRLDSGTFVLEVSLLNFSRLRRSNVRVTEGATIVVDATLSLSLSADVTVIGKRSFDLGELSDNENLVGVALSATQGVVSPRQIESRPIMRAGEVLETVPGVIISQHSGEGKANQYYLRGFNLDHGTDFATTVAGVPVNMPTHAHGHGYSDLNFLIPELIAGVQFNKGPYAAEEGDFSTAGASHIRYVNALDKPIARVSLGGDGWRRALAAASPELRGGHLLASIEVGHNDGPWERPDDYSKVNAVVRYSRGSTRNAFAVSAMAYSADWRSTDQIPARAIASGQVRRFGGLDDSLGGVTGRYSLSADWQRASADGVTRASAYGMRYRLNLFSNFTYFLDDPVSGDQFEQADRRYVFGGRVTHRMGGRIADRPAEFLFGVDTRHDDIGTIGLYQTRDRVRISTTREDAVRQTSAGVFVRHDLQWMPWLRSTLGVRANRFQFDVAAGNRVNSGREADSILSPKASLILGPWASTDLYVNWGTGFHSNDARGATITVDPRTGEPADRVTPLVRAGGEEVGIRSTRLRHFQVTAALWRLDLESELLFVGDAGTTAASRPSRRRGVELSAVYAPRSWVALDADLSLSRARFRDQDSAGDRVPGAVERVFAGGLIVENAGPLFGSLRVRHFGARDLLENGSVRSQPTTIVNLQAGTALSRRARLFADVFNLFDRRVNDIDYVYTSRLQGEPAAGVDDLHFHPALPRSVRIGLNLTF
jgi:hypothetical protein